MFGKITLWTAFGASLGLGLFLVALLSVDEVETQAYEPILVADTFDTAGVSAESFVVFDVETGTELAVYNADEVRPIASVTKLFTAASVLEEGDMEATTTITWSDVNTEGRAGKLEAYEEYSRRDLLWPLLLESSNDAAAALERVDPELLDAMNDRAVISSAENTRFADASGLSSSDVSTAHELARMVRDLFVSTPHLFDMTRLTQFIGEQTGWINNNPFVHEPEYRGGKHGFTYEANRTGAVIFEETLKTGESRLIGYVVLGSDDLASDVDDLRQQVGNLVSLE